MSTGKQTMGDLVLSVGIAYQTVLDIRIRSEEGTHGSLTVVLEVSEDVSAAEVEKLRGQDASVRLSDGSRLFLGVCTGAGLSGQGGYQTVCIQACTRSVLMDRKKTKRTFQDPGKTLGKMMREICGSYGADLTLDTDVPVSQVVYQQDETDWQFLSRIAAAQGKVLYTDLSSGGIRIYAGEKGFRSFSGEILGEESGFSRDLSEMAAIECCQNEAAEGYMVDCTEADCSELTVSAGDLAGPYVIRKGEIRPRGGILYNRVGYGYPESARPTAAAATQPGFVSGVLQGKVLTVSGNEIQVQFTTDAGAGETTWITYESFFSEWFYCMPDEGDTVFLYYENNGKIACLGSRHVNTGHPDFAKPKEKSMTCQDKMVRLEEKRLRLTATRELSDAESDNEVTIRMDETEGITIQCGRNIEWKAENIVLGAAVQKDADEQQKAGQKKLEERIAKGEDQVLMEGGYVSLAGRQFASQQAEQAEGFLKSLVFWELWNQEEEKETETLDAECFETGVLTLYGNKSLVISAGGKSSLELSEDVQIKAKQFQWLGYEQGSHQKEEKPLQDWWETALDGLQLVLDIAGCLPVLGAVPDLINAGISLCRGDFAGAAMSAVAAIPIVGDAAGAVKIGAKAVKALTKAERIKAIAKGVYMLAQASYMVYLNRDALAQVWEKLKAGDVSSLNSQDVSAIIQLFGAGVMGGRGVKSIGEGMIGKAKAPKVEGSEERKSRGDGTENKDCTGKGDPVNVVTGSFMLHYTDLALKDTGEDFCLTRSYESVYSNEGMMLGSRWFLNIETRILRDGERITLQRPDMRLEKFRLREGVWENERNGDASLSLTGTQEGYVVCDLPEQKRYAYDQEGRLTTVTDACGNRTELAYEGGVLKKLTLASGQFLLFTFESGKLLRVEDTIGRRFTYRYEGELLTSVTFPNGGEIRYSYTNKGFLHQVTDQNGNTYVTCEYDLRGRVTRQVLATGEEYVFYYDDRNRKNVFTNPKTGEHIEYEYGRQRVLLKERYPDGTYKEKRYDEWENCIYEKDCNGNETFREFDVCGKLLCEKLPDGMEIRYEYDAAGRKTKKTDSLGGEERFTYDERGCLTEHALRIEGDRYAVTSYTRDSRGRILSGRNANGNVTRYAYDTDFGEPTMKELPEGETFWYTYDEAGRCMSVTDDAGVTRYTYNRMDDVTAVTDPVGNTTGYRYDLLGNRTEVCLPVQYEAGKPGLQSQYDAMDRKVEEATPEGNCYLYRYFSEENLEFSLHPNAEAEGKEEGIRYEYDGKNRRIRTIYPDGGIERCFYDGNGNVVRRVLPEYYNPASDDGEGYRYTYDPCNRLQTVTGPDGNPEATYVYDGAGRILSYMGPGKEGEREASFYTHNCAGFLTSCRKPVERGEDGEIRYRLTTYQYDAMGNRTEEKRYLDLQERESACGRTHSIRYRYDRSNRLVRVEDSTGAELSYTYDAAGRRETERVRLNEGSVKETRYRYDAAGNVTARFERLEDGVKETGGMPYAVTEYGYDGNRNLTFVKLPQGGQVTYAYDDDNRLVEERHEETHGEIQNRIAYAYDHAGNLIRETDVHGHAVTYAYDWMDREVSCTSPDGGVKRSAYDLNGRLVREVLPQEHAEKGLLAQGYTYQYDKAGRRTAAVGPEGTVLERSKYDAAGNLVEFFDGEAEGEPKRRGARYAYDLAGRRVSVETPGGSRQAFFYDALGNLVKTVDGLGNATRFTVDEWGRITCITRADKSRERYAYDAAGNLTEAVDGEGHTVTYAYNCRGLLERRTDAAGKPELFGYDREGNLIERTDRNGTTLHLSYNMYKSLTRRKSAGGDVDETFGYYPDGRLRYALGGGMRYDYVYDAMGRLTEKRAGGRTLLSCAYDLNGNQTALKGIGGKKTEYRYDLLDRLTEVYDNGHRQALYKYHADGTVQSLKTGESLSTEYRYDRDKNLTLLRTKAGEETLIENRYRYDAAGNCVQKLGLEGETRYGYDSLYQLKEAVYPHGEERFTYDHAGNRLTKTGREGYEEYRYDAAGRLAERLVYGRPGQGSLKAGADGVVKRGGTDTFDVPLPEAQSRNMAESATALSAGSDRGSLVGSLMNGSGTGEVCPKPYDAAGKVLKACYRFEYDTQGNTVSDGENRYRYDSLNRLTEIKTKEGGIQKHRYDGEGLRAELEENGKLTRFLYIDSKAVEEQTEDGDRVRYIRGLELLSSDCESARTYYHYACDELGSVTCVTDGDGKVLNRYAYDAFGNCTKKEEAVTNRFGFAGEMLDGLTGQYYLRARFYSPVIGRFLQEDTYYGDGLNLYTYCRNNPVRYVDPSGHWCDEKQQRINKYKEQGFSDADAERMATYEKLRETDGIEAAEKYLQNQKILADKGCFSDDYLKNAANEIHNAQYGDAWWGKKNPITVTQAADGTIVISKNNGIIGKNSRIKAQEIFGDNAVIVGGKGVNYDNSKWGYQTRSPKHAEARGVQALLSMGVDPTDARQATTLPSCINCSGLQDYWEIKNLTGKVNN